MLIVAKVPTQLVSELLLAGVDVHVVVTDPAAMDVMQARFPGRLLDLAHVEDSRFDDVVLLADDLVASDGVPPVVAPWLERLERSLMVVLTGKAARFESRSEWERLFIQAGLRKHPMIEVVAKYSSLDEPTDPIMLMFEPIPAAPARDYPLEALIEERDLHTDMTREPGRRSDAHMTRYAQAAQFVRAGDRVLDLACGLGYGSHILANATQAASFVGLDASDFAVKYATANFAAVSAKPMNFRVGDAEKLDFLDNGSIDFAVSVETLEHLYHPEALLSELMRVLTPGGRAYLSVPFDWSDESGQDPNPFHHHVYDWRVLESQVRNAGFLIEKAWTQDAGGGQKLHHSKRMIREIDPAIGPETDGEWLLVLVMKPLGKPREILPKRADVPNILAFDRDYYNAALVRGLVSIGWRATSPEILEILAERVLTESSPTQADFGAALCVLCYLALEREGTYLERLNLAARATNYTRQEPANPTVLRWQVSLSFVSGLLHLSGGDRDAARAAFQRVAQFDVRSFSPLLGTKTVAAAFMLGEMALADGLVDRARSFWLQALKEVEKLIAGMDWREVTGPEGQWQTFGLPELADLLLTAAKAVKGLSAIRYGTEQPGMFWQLTHSTVDIRAEWARIDEKILHESFDVQRRGYEHRANGLAAAHNELLLSKEWLERQYHSLSAEVTELGRANMALSEAHEWLESQYHASTAAAIAAHEATEIYERSIASLTHAKEWLDNHCRLLTDEVARLGMESNALLDSKKWLEEQYRTLSDQVALLGEERQALLISKQWLDGQYRSLSDQVALLGEEKRALLSSKHWLESQYRTLTAEVDRLEVEKRDLSDAKDWLDGQYHAMAAELARGAARYDVLLARNVEIDGERHSLCMALESSAQELSDAQAQMLKMSQAFNAEAAAHREEVSTLRARIEYLEMSPIKRLCVRLAKIKRGKTQ